MVDWRTEGFMAAVLAAIALAILPALPLRAAVDATPGASAQGCTPDTSNPAVVDYCGSSLRYVGNQLTVPDIDMAQGAMRIKADLGVATTADRDAKKGSTWVFTGNVQMWTPQGQLRADKVTANIIDGRINSTVASGAPASFELAAQPGRDAWHGHAQGINYDATSSELLLQGNAYLSNGCDEINSQRITYNLLSQRAEAQSDADAAAAAQPGANARVHGTIRPQCSAHEAASHL